MSLRFGLVYVLLSSALAGVGQPTEKTVHVEVGESVQFTNNMAGVPPGTTWEWDFGDKSPKSNEPEPSHQYKKAGTNIVTLVAKTPNVPTPPQKLKVVVRAITELPPPDPKVKLYIGQLFRIINPNSEIPGATHEWIFGDNKVSNEYSPTKYYTKAGIYTVIYQRTIGGISSSRAAVKYEIFPITPKASSDAPTVKTGYKLQFKNDTEGPPEMTWEWDFGDNSPKSKEKEPYHVYEDAGKFEVTLTVKAPNVDPIYSKLKVIVTPVHVTPGIINASIAPKKIGADGNYTARITVEVKADGTYEKLTLKISGNLGVIKFEPEQSKDDAKEGKHIFEITVPEPKASVNKVPVDGNLKVIATIFPDNPKDKDKNITYGKTVSLDLTVIPQKPWWLLYAYILAGLIILGIIVTLVVLAKRPVVPGTATVLMGDETYLSSPSVGGPKKGKMTLQLGKLSGAAPEYDDYWLEITAARRDRTNRLRVSAILNTKLENDGDVIVNGEYHNFGKPIACTGAMSFEWTAENGQKMEVLYDTQQSDDELGYDDHSEDDGFGDF